MIKQIATDVIHKWKNKVIPNEIKSAKNTKANFFDLNTLKASIIKRIIIIVAKTKSTKKNGFFKLLITNWI